MGKLSNFLFPKLGMRVSENLGHHKRLVNAISHIKIFVSLQGPM